MRRLLGFALSLWMAAASAATDFDPFAGPRPLAVFIQSDPWAMVIGADTPRVAIYGNGVAVFLKPLGNRWRYHQAMLDDQALSQVRERLQGVLRLAHLKPAYVHTATTDQPTAMFYVRDGDRDVVTSVYGWSCPEKPGAQRDQPPTDLDAEAPPAELGTLHDWLCGFDRAGSAAWVPTYVEVMLWGYEYAPQASLPWPRQWPSLDSDRAIARGDSHSIFLDGHQLQALQRFLARRKPKGAVVIQGRKMAAAYRFAFPGEPIWQAAFRGTDR